MDPVAKKTTIGASWLVLTSLMLMQSWLNGLGPVDADPTSMDVAEDITIEQDPVALPEMIEKPAYDHAPEMEMIDERSATRKVFMTDEARVAVLSSTPVHYQDDAGQWQEIDLNLKEAETGWYVEENTFQTFFPTDTSQGVSLWTEEGERILLGIDPQLVYSPGGLYEVGPYETPETPEDVQVGGNTLRVPLSPFADLDYQVTPLGVKQNLVLREMPHINGPSDHGYFGLAETLLLPAGHALFDGEYPIVQGMYRTDGQLRIRDLETGAEIAQIPAPFVVDAGGSPLDQAGAEYLVVASGEHIRLYTMVSVEWMSAQKEWPILIDPTTNDLSDQGSGYLYNYTFAASGNSYISGLWNSALRTCFGVNSSQYACTSSTAYQWREYMGYLKFDASNSVLPGATVTAVDLDLYRRSGKAHSGTDEVVLIHQCTSTPCSSTTKVDPTTMTGTANMRNLMIYIRNSPAVASATVASSARQSVNFNFSSDGLNMTWDAANSTGAGALLGLGLRVAAGTSHHSWYYCTPPSSSYYCTSASGRDPTLSITYTGGFDSAPPAVSSTPYEGQSYITDSRQLLLELTDFSGINSTTDGAPRIFYRVNNGSSWTSQVATGLSGAGCSSSCDYSAEIPAMSPGDYVQYFWAFADAPTNQTPNTGTLPASTVSSGTLPNGVSPPGSPFSYEILDINTSTARKLVVLVNNQNSVSSSTTRTGSYDYQLTYYEDTREYHMEFDTSNCGTSTKTGCWNSAAQIGMRTHPSTLYHTSSGGGAINNLPGTPNIRTGPGSDIIYKYDSSSSSWAMIQANNTTGIQQRGVFGGDKYTTGTGSGTNDNSVYALIPDNFTGYFGTLPLNSTYNGTTNRNRLCVSSNGLMYFARHNGTPSSTYPCNSFVHGTNHRWNGFAPGAWNGRWTNGWYVLVQLTTVKPLPDTFAPALDVGVLPTSHTTDARIVAASINDKGEPPAGLNVNNTAGEGPTLHYRVNGTGSWTARIMAPAGGATRTQCTLGSCDWSTTIPGQSVNSTVEYHVTTRDVKDNNVTSATTSYQIGSPNKVLVFEWSDMNGVSRDYLINYQVRLYDVTNEIEFHYDPNSQHHYDYATIGYINGDRTIGDVIHREAAGYNSARTNKFPSNYRIRTNGTEHGWEKMALGMTPMINGQTILQGHSSGYPYSYYCYSPFYFNRYNSQVAGYNRDWCVRAVQIPSGFDFEYFGTNFSGGTDHIHVSRHGALKFDTTSSRVRMLPYYSNAPTIPGNTYTNPNTLYPWYDYYNGYYCDSTTTRSCQIRMKMIPFGGKGIEYNDAITTDTVWDWEMSPIHINPTSGDYLEISGDLTIVGDVEVIVEPGKGIAFTGACNTLTIAGNDTTEDEHVTFRVAGDNSQFWKGIAFVNGDPSCVDDQHTIDNARFDDADVALYLGSRHGSGAAYAGNTGNISLNDVVFNHTHQAIDHDASQGGGDATSVKMHNIQMYAAASSGYCFSIPTTGSLEITGGFLQDCNSNGAITGGAFGGGAGGDLFWIENVTMWEIGHQLINSGARETHISNVSGNNTFVTTAAGNMITTTNTDPLSSLYVYNFSGDHHTSGIDTTALSSLMLELVDMQNLTGTGIQVVPGGGASSASGPAAPDNHLIDVTVDTSGTNGLMLVRSSPTLDNVDVGSGAVLVSGNAPSTNVMEISDLVASSVRFIGCGWTVDMHDFALTRASGSTYSYIRSQCSSSFSSNTMDVDTGTIDTSLDGTNGYHALIAKRTQLTVVDVNVIDNSGVGFHAAARAFGASDVRLIQVQVNSTNITDSDISFGGTSGVAYLGGIVTVHAWRNISTNSPTHTPIANQNVVATLLSAGNVTVFDVGSHSTDGQGNASTWLLTQRVKKGQNGSVLTNYSSHTIRVAGGAGFGHAWDNGLRPGGYIEIEMFSPPQEWDTTMRCGAFAPEYILADITLSADLILDGCDLLLNRTSFHVNSSAINTPTIHIYNHSSLNLIRSSTIEALQSYPLTIVVMNNGGASPATLSLSQSTLRDLRQDSNTDSALYFPAGTVFDLDASTVEGSWATSSDMATVKIAGGMMTGDAGSVKNTGRTGTGVWFEDTASTSVTNLNVENAAIGVVVHKGAPKIDGFTLINNDVGMNIYGGMTLPTFHRSPTLAGASQGWAAYEVDLSSLLGRFDYAQLGLNSIYAGGQAHPLYVTSKYSHYYMIWDRMRTEITTDDSYGAQNITDALSLGYVDAPASHDCNTYGYTQGASSANPYTYTYYLGSAFNFSTEAIPGLGVNHQTYPQQYWGGYWPLASNLPQTIDTPGQSGYYSVCSSRAYTSYIMPPDGYRVRMPVVDISAGNITELSFWIDIFHYGANNLADRLELVIRGADTKEGVWNQPWSRSPGLADIRNGVIDGADSGITMGGQMASFALDNVTINSPTDHGLELTGSLDADISNVTVDGGEFGLFSTSSASGRVWMDDMMFDGQNNTGVHLARNLNLEWGTTSINGTAGPAITLGPAMTDDHTFRGADVSITNAELAFLFRNTGTIDLLDFGFNGSATDQIEVNGSAKVKVVDGTADTSLMTVAGNGLIERSYRVGINVRNNGADVEGAEVSLMGPSFRPAGGGTTDVEGNVSGFTLTSEVRTNTGLTVIPITDHEAIALAQTNTATREWRYSWDRDLGLEPKVGQRVNLTMDSVIDHRVCYGTDCDAPYAGVSTDGREIASYYGLGSSGYTDFDGKAILIDYYSNYIGYEYKLGFNNSLILDRGHMQRGYEYWRAQADSDFYMDNTTWISMGDHASGNSGRYMGSPSTNHINWHVNDTLITGLYYMAVADGSSAQARAFTVTNSTFIHSYQATGSASFRDRCLIPNDLDTAYIYNNTLVGCGAAIYTARSSNNQNNHPQSQWGADGMVILNNTIIDAASHGIWIGQNAHNDRAHIEGNTITGSQQPIYGIHVEDSTSSGTVIINNTDTVSQIPIRVNGADFWIEGNDITGLSDATYPGISTSNAGGTITGNTLSNADGGIHIAGIALGENIHISDNTVTQNGRSVPGGVGVLAENCGLSQLYLEDNVFSVYANAIDTDGCSIHDNGSTYTSGQQLSPYTAWVVNGVNDMISMNGVSIDGFNVGLDMTNGGTLHLSGDTMITGERYGIDAFNTDIHAMPWLGYDHTVSITSMAFSPSTMNIVAGDTVTWVNEDSALHTVTEDSMLFDSGNLSNSTFSWTFDMPGTYNYSCTLHPTMTGQVVVSAAPTRAATLGANDTMGTALNVHSNIVWRTVDLEAVDISTSQGAVFDDMVDFRWNGGHSTANRTLVTDRGAQGLFENITFAAGTTTHIDAGPDSVVTTVGMVLDPAKLIVNETAKIREANLLGLNVTYQDNWDTTPVAATSVGALIQSTDGELSSHVSPQFHRTLANSMDGDLSDWTAADLTPATDAGPGLVSSHNSTDLWVTFDSSNIYIAVDGADLSSSGDLLIYLDSRPGGGVAGDSFHVSHTLPFGADFLFWADNDGAHSGLKLLSLTGSWVNSACSITSYIGANGAEATEVAIPRSCIGGPVDEFSVVAMVQGEFSGEIIAIHPNQDLEDLGTVQMLNESITVNLAQADLPFGMLRNSQMIYRSYVGTNAPGPAREYDITVLVGENWGEARDINVSVPQWIDINVLRARPRLVDTTDAMVAEDSGVSTLDLTDLAHDFQDSLPSLTWTTAADPNPALSRPTLLDMQIDGQDLVVTTRQDQFGAYRIWLTVTDSHGLNDTVGIWWNISNVNDAPIIWNKPADRIPDLQNDGLGNINVDSENFAVHFKFLGSLPNASGSFIVDMGNEQPQNYTWNASTTMCDAFSVSMDANNTVHIYENTSNEFGGTCPITLTLMDDGSVNNMADPFVLNYTINPVNDDPEILQLDNSTGPVVSVDNGSTEADWRWDIMEDENRTENLTFNLSAIKRDDDHAEADLHWEVAALPQCDYARYFSITISGDDLVFKMVADATTDAPLSEIDRTYDNGIHQEAPNSGDHCTVRLYLNDTADPPSDWPSDVQYVQGSTYTALHIRVRNIPEPRPDYSFDEGKGFDFEGVSHVLPGTRIPVTVTVFRGGDALENWGHDIMVQFYTDTSDSFNGVPVPESFVLLKPPAWGQTVEVQGFVTRRAATSEVMVNVTVLAFDPQDPTRYFELAGNLKDRNWTNNWMNSTDLDDTAFDFPVTVTVRGVRGAPGFLPSLMAVMVAGLFVAFLVNRRRDEDEEASEVKSMQVDDEAVSPVIATILLVAITVVLAGVIYIWAAQLANASQNKVTPFVVFNGDTQADASVEIPYYRISVARLDDELSTSRVTVEVEYTLGNQIHLYRTNLANASGVYGRTPSNSPDVLVTFHDQIKCQSGGCESVFGVNDYIGVKLHDPFTGEDINSAAIRIYYDAGGQTFTLRNYQVTGLPSPSIR